MTSEDVVKALKEIKTYCTAGSLDALDYAIEVMEVFKNAGVKDPLECDCLKNLTK